MSAPWIVLGLEQNCSESDLKTAYARLLKVHRPDKDPEGFREIRNAYEWMRGYLERHKNGAPEEASGDESPEMPLQELDEPEAVKEFIAQLAPTAASLLRDKIDAALGSGDANAESDALRELVKTWRAQKPRGDVLDSLLSEQIERDPAPVLPLLTPADAVADVERDGLGVTLAWLKTLAARGFWPILRNVVAELERAYKSGPRVTTGVALINASRHLALLDWKRSQELLDLVYPHIPEEARDRVLSDLDPMIQAGKEIEKLRESQREVLAQAVASEKADPKNPDLAGAVNSVTYLGEAPIARAALAAYLPAFAARLRPKQLNPIQVERASRASSSGSGCLGLGSYWWVIIIVVNLLRFFGTNSSSNYSPPIQRYSPPPSYSPPSYSQPSFQKPDFGGYRAANPFRTDPVINSSPATPLSPGDSAPKYRTIDPKTLDRLLKAANEEERKKVTSHPNSSE